MRKNYILHAELKSGIETPVIKKYTAIKNLLLKSRTFKYNVEF